MTAPDQQKPHYSRSKALPNFTLSKADLIDLCKLAQTQLDECLRLTIESIKWNELDLDHQQLSDNLRRAFTLQIRITADDGSAISLDNLSLFGKPDFPEKIRYVYLSHHHHFQDIFNFPPRNYLSILLDFSKPSLALNFFNLPSNPTPNESNFELNGIDETWIDSTFLKIERFFREHKSRRSFLHKSGIYDIFLYLLFVPFSVIWLILIEKSISRYVTELDSVFLKIFIYIYILLIFGQIARLIFQYMRWIFPLTEYRAGRTIGPKAHRAFLSSILLIFVGPLALEVIKFFFMGN